MKIAINSLPRSGTKVLQANFHRYIKSAGYDVLCPDSFDSILEPFNFSDHELHLQVTKTGIDHIDNQQIQFQQKHLTPQSLTSEIISRFTYLRLLKQSWVFKRTPWINFDPILYQSAVNLDKCIAIIRSDLFEPALSFTLAKHLDIWAPTIKLEEAIKTHTTNNIKLDPKVFAHDYRWFKDYHRIKWVKDIQVVKFDEMIKLTDSKEFCDFFQIPFVEFDFHQFVIEYGDNKRNMISNIKELQFLADRIDVNCANLTW